MHMFKQSRWCSSRTAAVQVTPCSLRRPCGCVLCLQLFVLLQSPHRSEEDLWPGQSQEETHLLQGCRLRGGFLPLELCLTLPRPLCEQAPAQPGRSGVVPPPCAVLQAARDTGQTRGCLLCVAPQSASYHVLRCR